MDRENRARLSDLRRIICVSLLCLAVNSTCKRGTEAPDVDTPDVDSSAVAMKDHESVLASFHENISRTEYISVTIDRNHTDGARASLGDATYSLKLHGPRRVAIRCQKGIIQAHLVLNYPKLHVWSVPFTQEGNIVREVDGLSEAAFGVDSVGLINYGQLSLLFPWRLIVEKDPTAYMKEVGTDLSYLGIQDFHGKACHVIVCMLRGAPVMVYFSADERTELMGARYAEQVSDLPDKYFIEVRFTGWDYGLIEESVFEVPSGGAPVLPNKG